MRYVVALILCGIMSVDAVSQAPLAFPDGQPDDRRSGELTNLNGYFPFTPVDNVEQWKRRQSEIRRRLLVSQGLWPMPTKSPLRAVIHGRVEREDYSIDRVYFESIPGHFVTGSLYRPKGKSGPLPAILSPHGHWNEGRFHDAGEEEMKRQIDSGAESFSAGARHPIQARAVQLARMGCLVFVYDMTGNADSIQIQHRPAKWAHLDTEQDWGFMSVQADLRLQNMMGLQTWNSIRAIDFVLELPETDPNRIGVTGASGGGTQSMIISAIDERISAAMPCVMVSTAMQGGCTCENAALMRIDQGNIDIAAATAPRPLGLTAADDWTIELETKGYPDLVRLYEMLGASDRLTAVFHTEFGHNYNQVNRTVMYSFFNRHFDLGLSEPIAEKDFLPLSREEATVWNDDHPAPMGDAVGDSHERRLLRLATADARNRLSQSLPSGADDVESFRETVGGAWETILGRRLDQVGEVTFTEVSSSRQGEMTVLAGHVDHLEHDEQLPIVRIDPPSEPRGTVIWITNDGKAAVFDDSGVISPLARLVESGYSVLAADLFAQGEFLSDGPLASQPMWYQRTGEQGWHRFAGYTFGYNHCLFAKRVHDILTLIRFAQSRTGDLHLVGIGEVAGPLVTAARSQAGDTIERTLVDTGEFRFAQLKRHDDPMFVPGAVKYFDIDGLRAICAPNSLTLMGRDPSSAVAERAYAAAGEEERLATQAVPDSIAFAVSELVESK